VSDNTTAADQTADDARSRRRAVMADVAALAGVSHQTVSRVLNGADHVRPQTRERVLEAMRLLDYRPNAVARALVTGRSRTLGVVSFDTTLYGPASTLLGIERAAHAQGYYVSIVSMTSLDRDSLVEALARLHRQGVDGILVIAPLVEAVRALPTLRAEVPIVALEAGPEDAVPVVEVDQEAGARAATEHLLALGHRCVHHLAGPASFQESIQRERGWRAALAEAGAQAPEPLAGDWSAASGYELGRRLLEEHDPTAIFVANDQMALGVLRALHEAGRSLPHDLSVVGFDDIPEAAYFLPPLTTVRQDFTEMGERALHLVLAQLAGDPAPTRVVVAPELVVRSSTAAPPAGTGDRPQR
jgi:DNA-binding LacI/PurR family transcriptional regulator